ncbi:MAG: tandem-95 repeat protein [Mariniphaga sp.]|nr:tandem-95 repeat protein [Mariniphaga sp.]
MSFASQAQFVIQYPTSAQGITICLDTTLLTVQVNVGAMTTSNDSIFINFPQGVSYVSGTVTKTGGTPSLNIADAGGTPDAPIFVITPAVLSVGQNITFTLKRYASCSARTFVLGGGIFKDAVTVKGSAGTTRESDPSVNPYNIRYPSFSFGQPLAVNNTVPGGIYTRNFTITNGADGCADKVHFYVVYPKSGIELKSLMLDGKLIIPKSVKGDTLFFTISGTELTNDGLLCNGESLVFSETFKVKQCDSASSSYLAGWGCSAMPGDWCQAAGGQSTISAANGVPAYTNISRENIGFVDKCTPFDYTLKLTNGGTGDVKAATMYDVAILQGQSSQGKVLAAMDMSLFTLSNVHVGELSVPFTITNGIMSVNLNNLFTSDPDGPVGLDDKDGDGYFDDLPGGQSVLLKATLKFNCSVACNTEKSHAGFSATVKFHTMCDKDLITADAISSNLPLIDSFEITEEQFLGTAYLPANIIENVPFRLKLDAGFNLNGSYYDGANTRYRWKVVLPAGVNVSGSGNPDYGSIPATYTQIGDTVIYTSLTNLFDSFNIDLVYNCTKGGGTKNFNYTLEKIQDITTFCKCQGDLVCATVTTVAFCPIVLIAGPTTYIPVVRRTNGSLGWTDATLVTRQSASAISAFDLSKALYLDTIQIAGSARQINAASNIHLELILDKTSIEPVGINKLTPIIANVNIYRGGVLVSFGSLNAASQTSSTASQQSIDWDITSLLPVGGLLTGDSIFTVSKYQVSTNNGLPLNDIQSGNRWAFYNINASGGRDESKFVVPEMYIVGTFKENRTDPFNTNGCEAFVLGGNSYYLARRFNSSGVLFQNEYRPAMYIDSVVLDVPVGYEFISAAFRASLFPGSIPMIPNRINGHIYTFINPGTWKNLPITVANAYGGYVTVQVRPTCATQPVENIIVKTFVKDFYYAYAGSSTPSGMSVILEGPDGHSDPIFNSVISKPDILISDQTGLIQAAAPVESWMVRLSSASTSTVPYTWLGIPTKSGIEVKEIKDVLSNTVLTPISYSGGKWYQLSATGLSSGTNRDYRISFNYTTSGKDSLKVLAGWNCSGFPTNPDASPCGGSSIWLKFDPVASEVEIIPISVPVGTIDLCEPASFKYAVNSSQAGNIVDNTFSIKAPSGLVPVFGSFEAEYPLGAGNWTSLSPTISGNTYTYNLTEQPGYPKDTGLPGTINARTANHRQIGVRFKTITDCDFVANTNFVLKTTANIPSGKQAIGSLVTLQGPTIVITGVNPSYTTVNSLSSSNLTNCSNTATVRIQSTIVGGITGTAGILKIELPIGLELVPNSFVCSSAFCPIFISSMLQPDNKILLLYRLPSGIAAGSIMEFSMELKGSSLASCGVNTIELRTEDIVTGISCSSAPGGVCNSLGVVTGTGNTSLTIDKPSLSFTSLTGNVISTLLENQETYSVDFKINNSGTANLLSSTPLTIDFYCADGAGNPTGNVLSSYINAITLTSGGTYTSNFTFKAIGCSSAGNLVAVISNNSNCICYQVVQAFHPSSLPIIRPDNATTSEDTPVTFNITANDTNLDGAIDTRTLDLDMLTPGLQANLNIAGQGTFVANTVTGDLTFTPFANFNGLVTPFTYQVCGDGINPMCGQAIITVSVTSVNDIPTANNDIFSTPEDTPLNSTVAANDIASGDGGNVWSLIGAQGGATHGSVNMQNDGNFSYTPRSNYFGVDVFSYKLCDVDGDCSQVAVTITVNPVNDPPVAMVDNFVTKENQRLAGNILGNDFDIDRDEIILNTIPSEDPMHGTLALSANGDFIYQPIIDFMGTDSFIYQICDNGIPSLCSAATVTIVVSKDESCEVFVPNSFSPDGDGIHDSFKIRCLYNFDNPFIEIYNRWGNLVFKKDHYGNVDYWGSEGDAWWNGRSDNKLNIGNEELPVGTYYYVLKLNNIKALTGFLFLNK